MLKYFMVLLVFSVIMTSQAQSASLAERYPHLQRGINLAYWFWYAPENPMLRFEADEFVALRATGINFVRVPIDLGFIMNSDASLNSENLKLIDTAIEQLHAADLAVIIDLHSTSLADSDAANYSGALEDPAFVELYLLFWENFAGHLQHYSPELTIFGLMNEPVFYDNPEAWIPIQERLVARVRAVAPEHTLIVTGARWSSIDTLLELPLLDDDNLIYEFHFYEPFPFTHQGATWAGTPWQELRNVPYPSSPEALSSLLDDSSPEAREVLTWYGEERWNRASIAEQLERAVNWGRVHDVFLLCDEFGVYSNYAPADDRAQWIRDVREILEANHIAWAMWEYDGSFGMAERRSTGRSVTYDAAIVEALGLNMP